MFKKESGFTSMVKNKLASASSIKLKRTLTEATSPRISSQNSNNGGDEKVVSLKIKTDTQASASKQDSTQKIDSQTTDTDH